MLDNFAFWGVLVLSVTMIGGVAAVMIGAHRERKRGDGIKSDKDNSWNEFI
jgi:hypothetical protein